MKISKRFFVIEISDQARCDNHREIQAKIYESLRVNAFFQMDQDG